MIQRLGDLLSGSFSDVKRDWKPILATAGLVTLLTCVLGYATILVGINRATFVLRDVGMDIEPGEMRSLMWHAMQNDVSAQQEFVTKYRELAETVGVPAVEDIVQGAAGGDAEAIGAIENTIQEYRDTEPDPDMEQSEEEVAARTEVADSATFLLAEVMDGSAEAQVELQEVLVDMGMDEEIVAEKLLERAIPEVPLVVSLIVGLVLLSYLINTWAQAVFLLFANRKAQGPLGDTWQQALKYVFPLIGLGIWVFLRSFVWVPILLIIPFIALPPLLLILPLVAVGLALYFFPRLNLAFVYLVREEMGIRQSARAALDRSQGYWLKIVGNTIVWAIVAIVLVMVLQMLIGFILGLLVGGFEASNAVLLLVTQTIPQTVAGQLSMALWMYFITRLAVAIAENPQPAGPVPTVPPTANTPIG